MTKFGQAEYSDFMARVFADKLDEILEAADKQNFNSKNTEDIYGQFPSSRDGIRGLRNVRIYYWIACRRYSGSNHNVSLHCGKAGR